MNRCAGRMKGDSNACEVEFVAYGGQRQTKRGRIEQRRKVVGRVYEVEVIAVDTIYLASFRSTV